MSNLRELEQTGNDLSKNGSGLLFSPPIDDSSLYQIFPDLDTPFYRRIRVGHKPKDVGEEGVNRLQVLTSVSNALRSFQTSIQRTLASLPHPDLKLNFPNEKNKKIAFYSSVLAFILAACAPPASAENSQPPKPQGTRSPSTPIGETPIPQVTYARPDEGAEKTKTPEPTPAPKTHFSIEPLDLADTSSRKNFDPTLVDLANKAKAEADAGHFSTGGFSVFDIFIPGENGTADLKKQFVLTTISPSQIPGVNFVLIAENDKVMAGISNVKVISTYQGGVQREESALVTLTQDGLNKLKSRETINTKDPSLVDEEPFLTVALKPGVSFETIQNELKNAKNNEEKTAVYQRLIDFISFRDPAEPNRPFIVPFDLAMKLLSQKEQKQKEAEVSPFLTFLLALASSPTELQVAGTSVQAPATATITPAPTATQKPTRPPTPKGTATPLPSATPSPTGIITRTPTGEWTLTPTATETLTRLNTNTPLKPTLKKETPKPFTPKELALIRANRVDIRFTDPDHNILIDALVDIQLNAPNTFPVDEDFAQYWSRKYPGVDIDTLLSTVDLRPSSILDRLRYIGPVEECPYLCWRANIYPNGSGTGYIEVPDRVIHPQDDAGNPIYSDHGTAHLRTEADLYKEATAITFYAHLVKIGAPKDTRNIMTENLSFYLAYLFGLQNAHRAAPVDQTRYNTEVIGDNKKFSMSDCCPQ